MCVRKREETEMCVREREKREKEKNVCVCEREREMQRGLEFIHVFVCERASKHTHTCIVISYNAKLSC